MLVYRFYKSAYLADPLSAEGARRAGGRWNPKGYPILYTSSTPELALLEVVAHLDPRFVPAFNLLVLELPDSDLRTIRQTELPADWRTPDAFERGQAYLLDWLRQPDTLTVSVPSAIMPRSLNVLLHTEHPAFGQAVQMVENEPFVVDSRLYDSQ